MKAFPSSYVVRKDLGKDLLWKGGGPRLSRMDIELTERCNNNCIHCYINQPADDQEVFRREMAAQQVKGVLDEAASLGCLTVRLTGGEPLLRPDFPEIYIYARKLGIKVLLYTNATLVSAELAVLFKRYPPGEPVEITLYGAKRETYEAVSRVQGSYAAAMNGIDLLVKNAIPISLKSIALPGREDDLTTLRKLSEQLAAGKPIAVSMTFNLRGRRDSEEKNLRIKKIRATSAETLAILARNAESYRNGKKQFAAKFMRPPGTDLFCCGCGEGGAVDAYGNFQPCLLMRAPELVYNLKDGTIKDALDRFFPEKLEKAAENRQYLERCAQCFLRGLCDQCPAWSWMEHGTFDTPVEYLCEVAHEQARYLGLIAPCEKAWQIPDWEERIRRFTGRDGHHSG